jgi:predicted nucleic acid-binding protein
VTTSDAEQTVDEALDNDVILKAVRYGATELFWPSATRLGVLGAGKYVLAGRIKRENLADTKATIEDDLAAFLDRTEVLEPSEHEVRGAAELEREAQKRSLPLDAGESQLAAMVVERAIAVMSTGDKRAIASFEQLLEAAPWLRALCGRVRCLEQIALAVARDDQTFETLARCVCSDHGADKTMSICFSCYGGRDPLRSAVEQGLVSYIEALRGNALQVLAPTP